MKSFPNAMGAILGTRKPERGRLGNLLAGVVEKSLPLRALLFIPLMAQAVTG